MATNPALIQAGGAWPAVAQVSSPGDIVFGGAIIAVLGGLYFVYYRRPLPPAPNGPWWATRWVDLPPPLTCFGLVLLWVLPGRSVGRKARVTAQTVFGWMAFVLVVVVSAAAEPWFRLTFRASDTERHRRGARTTTLRDEDDWLRVLARVESLFCLPPCPHRRLASGRR